MMDTTQLKAYCQRHGLSEQARNVIDHVRASDPSRRVQSGTHNVACRYSSRKMGLVIQAESHDNELPAVVAWEHDERTYEFYDQPPKVKLRYTVKERNIGHLATPDYFLLQEDFAGWVECKTEDWLQARLAEGSNVYVRDGAGGWRCPPGEEYAASVGLQFRVRSSAATHWNTIRNLHFLADFLDESCPAPTPTATCRVWNAMAGRAWVVLKELLDALLPDDVDVLFKMIADDVLYFRLDHDLLAEPERAFVFRDKVSSDAYRVYLASQAQSTLPVPSQLTVMAGQSFLWDGRVWKILNVGDKDIFFDNEERAIANLERKIFDQMVKEGMITGIPGAAINNDQAVDVVRRASPRDFKHAMYRYYCLFPEEFDGEPVKVACERAKRKWRALFNRGRELLGSGLLGLIPKISQRGNRDRRIDKAVIQIMEDVIDEHYAVACGWSITQCWGAVVNHCSERGLLSPSEVAFRDQIKRRSRNELIAVREGEKAAYSTSAFYWYLEGTTPRHGERVFEYGHMDHTELDLQFRGSRNGEQLGKAWLSVLIDAWSRTILAWVITFDAPSYRTCMALIRACIERHGRIPRTIILDKGPEFQSVYLETLLARLTCHKKTRPGSKPRFGSIVERFFGLTNEQFVHSLRGNNVALQNPRSMSPSHDPRELSVWTLPAFTEAFDGFLDRVYGEMEHSALGLSPKQALAVGLAHSGLRRHTLISNTRDLTILCLPSTPKGTAKIDPARGVKIGYIYYWCSAFRDPKVANTEVPVRYDPNDKSMAVAWVKGRWENCNSEHAAIFRGHTEKEIKLITQEITAKNKRTGERRKINATLIARYLTEMYGSEQVLLQRQRDQESRSAAQTAPAQPSASAPRADLDDLENATWAELEHEIFGG